MVTTISDDQIIQLLIHQLYNFFKVSKTEKKEIQKLFPVVMKRTESCFFRNSNKYFHKEVNGFSTVCFNPFNSVQYCMFLYLYSRVVYENNGDCILADKIYYLNKTLNGCDLFYAIELPNFWGCEHPLGSVLGRAKYGNGFFFYQGCTVGGNKKLQYPIIGENVRMFAHSQIIGNAHVGDNVLIGADCTIKDQDVPANSLVFGSSPNLIFKIRKDLDNGK